MTSLKQIVRGRGTAAVATAGLVAVVGGVPLAVGATSNPLTGGARNPSANKSSEYTSETQIIANTSTYGTRQSNKSDNGGGAIYGCRSRAGGTVKGFKPCIRANNLSDGYAFEFQSDNGNVVGAISTSKGGDQSKPFVTNATGVADGLNADRVDGKNASDFIPATDAATFAKAGDLLFAAVGADGKAAGRGVVGDATLTPATNTFTVTFNADVSKCSFTATENGTTASNVNFSAASAGGTKVTVDETDAVPPQPFHLQVIC